MSEMKSEKHFKYKKLKKKPDVKKVNQIVKEIPSTSRQEVSSNWLNFLKTSGSKENFFNKKTNIDEKIVEKKKPQRTVITKVVSIDCEMVGDASNQNILARVSVVNFKLDCIYDKYVKPVEEVLDYRTRFSGIREEDLKNGVDFEIVQNEVRTLLRDKILVGHALHNDFRVLKFRHHARLIRDTATYPPFKECCSSGSPSLKKLAKVFLNENIQEGEHNSIEDAKTAMKLYKKFRKEWEQFLLKPSTTVEVKQ